MDNEGTRQRELNAVILILLSVSVLLAYQGVAENAFINYDDPSYVTENYHVKEGLSADNLRWAFTTSFASNWHPLTWISLMVDRELFGMNPGGYHWTNMILHLSGGLLLFGVLNRMTGYPWRSALVAGLFLLHPLHVESVAWVAERKDVLSALFWMLGMWGYARYAKKPGFWRYASVLFFFMLGLLSKPMVVTFPFVLLLLDYWPLGRIADGRNSLARLVYEKIPLFILSATSCVITFLVQRDGEAVASLQNLPILARIGNAVVAYGHYLVKTVWPVHLAVFYPHPGFWPIRDFLIALTLVLLISLFVLIKMKRFPYLAFGWFWYLGTLVPVIGLVQVGAQAMADRYTYLPLIGIFVMAIWGAADILKKAKTGAPLKGILSGGLIVVLIVMTQIQVGYWKNSFTLFMHARSVTEKNYQAQNNIGQALAAENRFDEAAGYYREAMRCNPGYMPAYYNLGLARMEQGREGEAMASFANALRIRPRDASVLFSRGVLFAKMERWDEAIGDYREAETNDPDNASLHNNLGVALTHRGRLDEAIHEYRKAIRLNPGYAGAHNNLAMLLIGRGETNEAITHFRQAIYYQPDYANAHHQLGVLLQNLGKDDEAAYHFKEAKRINPEIGATASETRAVPPPGTGGAHGEAGKVLTGTKF